MNYVYSDEDNYPMTDEKFEAEQERANELAEVKAAEEKEARSLKRKNEIKGLADMLELTGDCVECPYFVELAEGFLDANGLISSEQIDFLKMQCSICDGKGTGKPKDEKHRRWIEKDWSDLQEWVKVMDLKYRCAWCPNVYRVYGNYKDPDDEWRAIEDLCGNCKHFVED